MAWRPITDPPKTSGCIWLKVKVGHIMYGLLDDGYGFEQAVRTCGGTAWMPIDENPNEQVKSQ